MPGPFEPRLGPIRKPIIEPEFWHDEMIYGCVLELSEPPGVRNKLGGHRVFYTLSRGDNLCVWWGNIGLALLHFLPRDEILCKQRIDDQSSLFLAPNFSPAAFFPNWTSLSVTRQAWPDWLRRYEWFISRHWESRAGWREREATGSCSSIFW